jgi:hypothetical protein
MLQGVSCSPNYDSSDDMLAEVDWPNACTGVFTDTVGVFNQLGINVIHIWLLVPENDHSECMKKLQGAGIYVIVNIELQSQQGINFTTPTWDTSLYNGFTKTIDSLAPFSNVLGFVVGDMRRTVAISSGNYSMLGYTVVKAAARDLKSYIKSRHYRQIPVGSLIHTTNAIMAVNYLTCGNSTADTIDFIGLWKEGSWCTATTKGAFTDVITNTSLYQASGIPIFISDYGCTLTRPRTFEETEVLYGPLMSNVVSAPFCASL